jgi:ABC-2 type transport system permease protein
MTTGQPFPATGRLSAGYLRFEVVRTLRNRWFLVFSIGFPIGLYFLIAGPNRDVDDFLGTGLSATLYYMVGIASFSTMSAMLATGTRIAIERDDGWNRLLRTTPLSPVTYLVAKIATAYLMVLVSLVLLFASGYLLGVRLPVTDWLWMSALVLIGLVPFAGLGVFLGHLLKADTVGAAVGILVGVLAFIGGAWFPLGDGVLYQIGRLLPSYWLVQASQVALGGAGWTAFGWIVVAAWSVLFTALAARAFLRDTRRA